MTTDAHLLADNLRTVRERIARAAERAGRAADDVRVVAVTKYVGSDVVRALVEAGAGDVGENRAGPLLEKHAALGAASGVTWHFIGHLQRNKVRRVLPAVDVLHSGDGMALLRVLDAEVARAGLPRLPVLLQVNVSGERTKGGFALDAVPAALAEARELPNLRLAGLMTMAPDVSDPELVRPVFSSLREMRDEVCSRGYLEGAELSMGMSGDFEVAVEEGATIVRIGRILFEGAV